MHVGTVRKQLNAYAGGELLGQRLVVERATVDAVASLVEQQREGVLHLTYLPLQIDGVGLHLIVACLSTLHAGRAGTSELHLQLHHVPRLLRQPFHVVEDGQLLVEHHQRVVERCNTTDDARLGSHLIVFHHEQLHLCRAFLREDIAEEIDIPRCRDGQLIGLRGGGTVHLHTADGAAGSDGHARQEGQLGHLQHVLHHLHVQRSIAQVGIVLQGRLNECLQLGVGKDLSPGQLAEVLVSIRDKGIDVAHHIADQALRFHVRPLILIVESTAGQQE